MSEIPITYGNHNTAFGPCLIAVTERGICLVEFLNISSNKENLRILKRLWPDAVLTQDNTKIARYAKSIFDTSSAAKIPVVFTGTNFQIKVWKALRTIPFGKTVDYSYIARKIGKPKAFRAVGTACGKNSLAFLIPCHRVLTSKGGIGGYRWGVARKRKILAWEAARGNKV